MSMMVGSSGISPTPTGVSKKGNTMLLFVGPISPRITPPAGDRFDIWTVKS